MPALSRYPLRVGVVILPDEPWSRARHSWLRAEELDFDHAWTYDHLTWRGHRDASWFGAIPTLSAAAIVTSRIRIGPLVASPNFRHPLPLAKELITLDDISEGRLILGLGAGGTGWDATMFGHAPWSPRERAERFEEFVRLTARLLAEPAVTYEGRYYSVDEARTYPGCVQQPRIPLALAATGPRGMRLAASIAETWVTTGPRDRVGPLDARQGAAEVRQQIAVLERACTEVGRDPASIDRLVLTGLTLDAGLASLESFAETAAHYADVGVTDLVVHWPRHREPYVADQAMFEALFTQ